MWSVIMYTALTLGCVFVVVLMVLLFLLVKEDLRLELGEIMNKRARKAAEREIHHQNLVEVNSTLYRRIYYHGIDRETGRKRSGWVNIPTDKARQLWGDFEEELSDRQSETF